MTWENLRIEISDGTAVVTIWDAGVSEETPATLPYELTAVRLSTQKHTRGDQT
jgi:hypothetical protein